MRNKFVILLFSLIFSVGCVSSEVKDQLSDNAAKLDGYVTLMEAGETTSEQDQNLIHAMRVWTWSMNRAANGEEPPPDVKLVLNGLDEDE